MIVSLMSHFLDKEHIDEILTICGKIDHDGYYVKMGNAWALSVCYVKFPEKTRAFLEKDTLDDFTHNKAIQKSENLTESVRKKRTTDLFETLKIKSKKRQTGESDGSR